MIIHREWPLHSSKFESTRKSGIERFFYKSLDQQDFILFKNKQG